MQEEIGGTDRPLPLAFDGLLVIVGGGSFDEHLLHQLAANEAHLVGADGGGDIIRMAGFRPEAIIGDFDSLEDPTDWDERTKLVRIREQETTDFEKALYSTTAPVTVALGMTGKRFDHTLAALDAVVRYAGTRNLILVDESDIALVLAGPFDFHIEYGARVSVHPLTTTRFARSEGLKYPLDGLELTQGIRTGTSNMAVAADFAIEPEPGDRGVYLLILDRHWLWKLIDRLQRG